MSEKICSICGHKLEPLTYRIENDTNDIICFPCVEWGERLVEQAERRKYIPRKDVEGLIVRSKTEQCNCYPCWWKTEIKKLLEVKDG